MCPTDLGRGPGLCQEGARAGQPGLLPHQGAGDLHVLWPCQLLRCLGFTEAAGATKGLPKRRRCHVDALARGSHLDVFAQLHKTNTPTEQLGCGISGFTDPFLSLPPNPLLAAAHGVGPYGVFPGDADNGSHILRFPPVQWDCTTIKMPITGPL